MKIHPTVSQSDVLSVSIELREIVRFPGRFYDRNRVGEEVKPDCDRRPN